MLCKYGGLRQREVGRILGLKSGTGVSLQLRKLAELLGSDASFRRTVQKLDRRLSEERC